MLVVLDQKQVSIYQDKLKKIWQDKCNLDGGLRGRGERDAPYSYLQFLYGVNLNCQEA